MAAGEKPALRPANENPWYWLATLYGEVPHDGPYDDITNRNRLAWNRWIAAAISPEQRSSLIANGFPEPELAPFTSEETSAFHRAFAARAGRDCGLPPGPDLLIDFDFTHFDRIVDFRSFLFSDSTSKSAKFSDLADFESATFSGYADFGSATFSYASFRSVTFSALARFKSATFSGYVCFGSATFSGDIFFLYSKFIGITTFTSTVFGSVPDFRGATMNEATEWHGAIWPKPRGRVSRAKASLCVSAPKTGDGEAQVARRGAALFLQRAARSPCTRKAGSRRVALNLLYESSSNYGQSIALPTLWLFAVFVMGGAAFYVLHATTSGTSAVTFQHAAALSFANIFPFVPSSHDFLSETPFSGWSRIEKAIAVSQTVVGTPLLFLLGLSLRNRFRMK